MNRSQTDAAYPLVGPTANVPDSQAMEPESVDQPPRSSSHLSGQQLAFVVPAGPTISCALNHFIDFKDIMEQQQLN